MQNKKSKNQIKKDIRRMHEQMGAIAIALGVIAGSVAVSHEARRVLMGLAMHPAFAVVEHTTEHREVAHRAVRYNDGLRTPFASGGMD